MARSVVLFRNLNQGQRGMPTTEQLRSALESGGAGWVLTFQTNGTAVVDAADPEATVASALGRLRDEVGYADQAVVLDLAQVQLALAALPPAVTEAPPGMELYQDVLAFVVPADGLDLKTPWTGRHGDLVVHSVDPKLGMVHGTAFRRGGKVSGNLTADLERHGVRATTRTRGTMERLVAKVVKAGPPL